MLHSENQSALVLQGITGEMYDYYGGHQGLHDHDRHEPVRHEQDLYSRTSPGASDRGGSFSSYGGWSSGSRGGGSYECCPLVVDPLTLVALLAFIAGGTYFLNIAITMNIVGKKRRKRSITGQDVFLLGRTFSNETVTNLGDSAA